MAKLIFLSPFLNYSLSPHHKIAYPLEMAGLNPDDNMVFSSRFYRDVVVVVEIRLVNSTGVRVILCTK